MTRIGTRQESSDRELSGRGGRLRGRWHRRALALTMVAVAASAVAVALRHSSVLAGAERSSIDLRFSLRGTVRPPRNVVIVGLDADSVANLPRFPFSRVLDADVITHLHAAGARLIVYDFAFDRPTTLSADDDLISAAKRAAPVVFGTALIMPHGQTEILGGNANLRSFGDDPAAALLPLDPDDVIRHLTGAVKGLPSIASVVQRLLTGHRTDSARIDSTGAWIDFAGPPGTFPTVSFENVLSGHFDHRRVRGKIVIVGPTASVLQDLHATSVGGQMSGAEVQANAISTLLGGLPLRDAPSWLEIALIIIVACAVCVTGLRFAAPWVAAAGVVGLLAWCAATVIAFDNGRVLEFAPEALALVLAGGGAAWTVAVFDAREHRRLRELFASGSSEIIAGVLAGGGDRALSPTEIIAGYRIDAEISRGGMGIVYRANQLELNRTVAVKLIHPDRAEDKEHRARFELECQAAAAVEHANVIPVYRTGEDNRLLFIAMRLVNGRDLGHHLRFGRLDRHRTIRIVDQVAGALDAAHAIDIVHRDVKPANVLITDDQPEHVYLTDFGIAKWVGSSRQLTKADRWLGTLDYAAPEQLRGEEVDERADVYALAALLYHCLAGEPPYTRETEAATLLAHLNEPPPKPTERDPALPESIDAVIAKGLGKDPDSRYQTAGELARAAANALGVESQLPSMPPPVAAAAPFAVAGTDQPTSASNKTLP